MGCCTHRSIQTGAWVSYGACVTFLLTGVVVLYLDNEYPTYIRVAAITQMCVGVALLIVWGFLHGITQYRDAHQQSGEETEEMEQLTDIELNE